MTWVAPNYETVQVLLHHWKSWGLICLRQVYTVLQISPLVTHGSVCSVCILNKYACQCYIYLFYETVSASLYALIFGWSDSLYTFCNCLIRMYITISCNSFIDIIWYRRYGHECWCITYIGVWPLLTHEFHCVSFSQNPVGFSKLRMSVTYKGISGFHSELIDSCWKLVRSLRRKGLTDCA